MTEEPSHKLMMEMLETAEWERARGHLMAMLNLGWTDDKTPCSSAMGQQTISWLEMNRRTEQFIKWMDEHFS